jgi:quercetin dioxygenase-like cupin family protein
MNTLDLHRAIAEAQSGAAARPATAIVHDSADARLIVFRIAPGQSVAPHSSPSTVMLSIISGRGTVSGDGRDVDVAAGDLVTYAPDEMHGMRATTEELALLAIIAPRPGSRRTDPVPLTSGAR